MTSKVNLFYLQAIALPDDKLFRIDYQISKENYGQITLSNTITEFKKVQKEELKKYLLYISDYATNCNIIPKP